MRIIVNGESHDTDAGTVSAVLAELGLDGAIVATALNGEFVPKSRRPETVVAEGDHLDVLAPMQGG
ncbi:MAG TPA: sulfur carrier protein ThiS [Gammaproteobacteria bacterium]